jgi:pimeloyl-ACP methyl ester carboxylesterase
MTLFLNFRTRSTGGAVNPNPQIYNGLGDGAPGWSLIPPAQLRTTFAGKSVLFAVHGFNVDQPHGAVSLGLLDKYLALAAPGLLVGVLWPGDSVIPIVDYPFEGSVAIDCGTRLANFCNDFCSSAQTISFVSHSLGARLVLEAVSKLNRKARSVCLTAAAINRDCLTAEYAVAAQNSEQISLLASREDLVLKVAFSVGDPFADLLHDDHTPFEIALGSEGPPTPTQVRAPWQINETSDYGHSDYMPPACPEKWPRVADFMKRAFLDQPQVWP